MDTQVLCQKRSKPRVRQTIPQILKQSEAPPFHQRKFFDWGKKWVSFAEEMGEAHAVRPRKIAAIRLSQRRASGKFRENIFLQASIARGNKVKVLHQALLAAGLDADAAAVAHMLVGMNHRPRKNPRKWRVPGYHLDSFQFVEKRVLELAEKYKFLIKPKTKEDSNQGNSRRLGNRYREIMAHSPEKIMPLDYLKMLLSDKDLIDSLGHRVAAFQTLFQHWNEWQQNPTPPSKLGVQKVIAKEHNLSIHSLHTWWRLFDKWNHLFNWYSAD